MAARGLRMDRRRSGARQGEGLTVTWVVAGQKYGGVARQEHTKKECHALPANIM